MNFNSEHFQNRPHSDEFDPFYSVFVAKVGGNQILGILESQISKICILLSKLTEETAQEVHAPYRWTIKLVLGHLIDGEKVFGYRLLRFASGDQTVLSGFDQGPYVDQLDYQKPSVGDLLKELDFSRQSNLMFLKRLPPDYEKRTGIASGCQFSVRALAFILAGHVTHHFDIVEDRLAGSGEMGGCNND
ncbi:MAG: DinB family protein [Pirellulaceae bacterium]|nr:DinB family protein [Pirellulaceae bacterium]